MNNIYSQVTPGFESAMAHEASRVEQQFGMHRFQVSGFSRNTNRPYGFYF
jgi:hypothetical protein